MKNKVFNAKLVMIIEFLRRDVVFPWQNMLLRRKDKEFVGTINIGADAYASDKNRRARRDDEKDQVQKMCDRLVQKATCFLRTTLSGGRNGLLNRLLNQSRN